MSTHNIGFYEDLTKIIFEISSNTHLISSAEKLRNWYSQTHNPVLETKKLEIFKTRIVRASDYRPTSALFMKVVKNDVQQNPYLNETCHD